MILLKADLLSGEAEGGRGPGAGTACVAVAGDTEGRRVVCVSGGRVEWPDTRRATKILDFRASQRGSSLNYSRPDMRRTTWRKHFNEMQSDRGASDWRSRGSALRGRRSPRARTRLQLRAYRERIRGASDGSLESRVRVLAAIRREQGYMAECVTRADGSLLLRENHCPICVAAKSCQGLCREELGLFRAVLGTRTHVERTDHILAGASRCAYVITPRS